MKYRETKKDQLIYVCFYSHVILNSYDLYEKKNISMNSKDMCNLFDLLLENKDGFSLI